MAEQKFDEKEELKKALEEIEFLKEQARAEGRSFSAPSEEELKKKIKRTNTPYISGQGWSHGPPGTTITYTVYIRNPDPTSAYLNAYVFFGPANLVSDAGEALGLADTRFPRLGARSIYIAPGSSTNVSFSITIPSVASSTYFGNCFVFKGSYHDIGSYIDRGFFPVNVT
jgi:hypothetical protein